MYHKNPVINDLMLTIINDGNGSQCGVSYKERCESAENGIFKFRYACRTYGRARSRSGARYPTRDEIITAANLLQEYYREHVSEF